MAKNEITDYSTTASSNTDIGGVGLTDNDPANNTRDSLQQMAAALARSVAGLAPWTDTFSVCHPDDKSKAARLDTANVPSGTTRALESEALNRNCCPVITQYTTSGTHTFLPQSRFYRIEACAGGGGGGGVDGQGATTFAAGSGGSAGFWGYTDDLPIPVDGDNVNVTGTVVIGTGGGGGAGSSNGTDGTNTTWSDGTNSFGWTGGPGGKGVNASGKATLGGIVGVPSAPTGVSGHGERGWIGNVVYDVSGGNFFPKMVSGRGGQSPYANGGAEVFQNGTGGSDGNPGGRGAGGSGAVVVDQNNNYTGGAGGAGFLIVMEW